MAKKKVESCGLLFIGMRVGDIVTKNDSGFKLGKYEGLTESALKELFHGQGLVITFLSNHLESKLNVVGVKVLQQGVNDPTQILNLTNIQELMGNLAGRFASLGVAGTVNLFISQEVINP